MKNFSSTPTRLLVALAVAMCIGISTARDSPNSTDAGHFRPPVLPDDPLCPGCQVVELSALSGTITCILGSNGIVKGLHFGNSKICSTVGTAKVLSIPAGTLVKVVVTPTKPRRANGAYYHNTQIAKIQFETSLGVKLECGSGVSRGSPVEFSKRQVPWVTAVASHCRNVCTRTNKHPSTLLLLLCTAGTIMARSSTLRLLASRTV
jgi:hypothetical protein